jgi:hypothetical protein
LRQFHTRVGNSDPDPEQKFPEYQLVAMPRDDPENALTLSDFHPPASWYAADKPLTSRRKITGV